MKNPNAKWKEIKGQETKGKPQSPQRTKVQLIWKKTIDVDEALQDSTQNSQQENGSVIIQDEIIEGRQSTAGNYSKKNKKTNSHKEVQHKNTQRSLKPIVIIGDSIIKHINPKKLSRRRKTGEKIYLSWQNL